jgi:hypothetical protein
MKHTPEPWKVDGGKCRNAIVHEFGQMAIAECWYRGNWENTRANAARIVACINACAGMEDPAKEIEHLRSQNRKMLAALNIIKEP